MATPLATDGYKFSMAQAGFPLRHETFYFSFRRGGFQLVPFDIAQRVEALRPELEDAAAAAFAAQHGYALDGAMLEALSGSLEVDAVPPMTWVHEREPIATITGPSFLVSWLEPRLLMLNYPIQLATALATKSLDADATLHTLGPDHVAIIEEVCAAVGAALPTLVDDREAYRDRVRSQGRSLVEVLGSGRRIFEVGLRAAITMEQHRAALEALADVGIVATSNVAAAHALGLVPVGTMGHEHVQRWGADLAAFRAMRDMRLGTPSYLLDTFDTVTSGIPAAIRVMAERAHDCSIRYDSGDKYAQYMYAHGEFSRAGLTPVHILEDGLDLEMTRKFESLREFTGLDEAHQVYGYGGHLIARPARNPYSRDRVSAVYKLAETSGEPRMKFGNESGLGKVSVPGRPVAWRRIRGRGPLSMIGQADEPTPEDFVALPAPDARHRLDVTNAEATITADPNAPQPYRLSPATRALIERIERSLGRRRPEAS